MTVQKARQTYLQHKYNIVTSKINQDKKKKKNYINFLAHPIPKFPFIQHPKIPNKFFKYIFSKNISYMRLYLYVLSHYNWKTL